MTDTLRELDHRLNDGIEVRLLWDESTNEVFVSVRDGKTAEAFEVPVHAGESALDVFHHPYAYAAHRRIERRPLEASLS